MPLLGNLGLDTRVLYTGFVALVALGRLAELGLAGRNRRRLIERGGVEVAPGHYRWMVLVHAGLLLACPLEVWLLDRPFLPALAAVMLALFLGAFALRWWVIRTLGERWTTRIVCLPGAAPIQGGPYRFLRHPNYLAVVVEIFALPMIHTAWLSVVVFTVLDGLVLRVRIAAEEEALSRFSDYGTVFASRPRMVPGRAER
jgi:methyltransferase